MEYIDRDPYGMLQAANELDEYARQMRGVCAAFKANVANARAALHDDPVAMASLPKIEKLADDLVRGLPRVQAMAQALKDLSTQLQMRNSRGSW
jgi:hypothetical protein